MEPTPKLNEALAKAKLEFDVIEKNCKVDVKNKEGKYLYTFWYADLNEVDYKTAKALSKNGLAVSNQVISGNLVVSLRHSSGEALESSLPLPANLQPRDLGGALTYFKRYLLIGLLGVVADDDADANDPSTDTTLTKKTIPAVPPQTEPVTQQQAFNNAQMAGQANAARPPNLAPKSPLDGTRFATPPKPEFKKPLP